MEKEIELEQEAIVVYSGGGAVNSVNGYTGDVVLTTSDLENTSDYQTGTEVESAISTAIAGKQDTLTAGNNITISNNTISATDTTYSAGTGLTLNGTQFSVDTGTIATQQDVSNEATARANADINLQGQIDAISSASDVTDIVGTYAALQAYDTTHLKDNDIIKVLQDESQNDETTYYRWSTSTQTFTLIGEEGPYYTKSQTDTLLQAKQDTLTAGSNITIGSDNTISATDTTYTAGTNVSISSGNVISATDTTYTAGTGLSLNGTQFSADTSVLATQTDLSSKQNTLTAGSNITISGDTISATDTTYSNFTGTDGTAAGAAGLVPAPATTDAGKFLKADGTWSSAGGDAVKTLTSSDFNWNLTLNSATEPYDCVALWLLEPGTYNKMVVTGVPVAVHANPGGIETLGMGTYIVATESVNPDKKQILYTTANYSRKWYQQLVTVSNGTSSGTRQFIMDNNVVQTTGTSTTDVMSQNATTSMIFSDPSTAQNVSIGNTNAGTSAVSVGANAYGAGTFSVAIGQSANTYRGNQAIAIGLGARARSTDAIAIGHNANQGVDGGDYSVTLGPGATARGNGSISLGANSQATQQGEMNIGSSNTSYGYNNTNYRLLSGVHDPVNAQDAATKGYVDPTTDASAPTTATVGRLGQIQIDTTTATAYMCVAVDTVTPAYTWKQITA